jgi:hypothetical protein
MRTRFFSILFMFAGVAVPAAFADSIACVPGTVTSIANKSCTIGGCFIRLETQRLKILICQV